MDISVTVKTFFLRMKITHTCIHFAPGLVHSGYQEFSPQNHRRIDLAILWLPNADVKFNTLLGVFLSLDQTLYHVSIILW